MTAAEWGPVLLGILTLALTFYTMAQAERLARLQARVEQLEDRR